MKTIRYPISCRISSIVYRNSNACKSILEFNLKKSNKSILKNTFIFIIDKSNEIIGIPIGVQCFKFAALSLAPFGKKITIGTRFDNIVLNIFWIILTGVPMAVINALCGVILCITVIGIPFGIQFFKLAQLSLLPFGAKIE